MKSVNPELSQKLDEIPTDKLNALTSSPDTIQSKEETQLSNNHKGKKQHCMCWHCNPFCNLNISMNPALKLNSLNS